MSKRHLFAALVAFFASLSTVEAQCLGERVRTAGEPIRYGFNEVLSGAASEVEGDDAENWQMELEVWVYVGSTQIHYQELDGPGDEELFLHWSDMPSTAGTGVYTIYSRHRFECGPYDDTWYEDFSLVVSEPEITNRPFNDALWYFGSGTPSAVPGNVGHWEADEYAYQYANLGFSKNCGIGDSCGGSITWGEIDAQDAISVASNGVMTSKKGHSNCVWDSAVTASLDGWDFVVAIFVNKPTTLARPSGSIVTTEPWGTSGYKTQHPWYVRDNCGYGIASMALNETFGDFEKPGVVSGWTDPPLGHAAGYNDSNFVWIDSIAADYPSWNPAPVYTGPGPDYTYTTLIMKNDDQKWFVGTQTHGQGTKVFDGEAEWYQDHGKSQ